MKSHCGDPSLVFTRRPVTAPAPTRNRASSTGRPFTHADAASDASDGIADEEDIVDVDDAEVANAADVEDDEEDAP